MRNVSRRLSSLWVAPLLAVPALAVAHTVTFTGQSPGPTPFIATLAADVTDPTLLTSVQFTIAPQAGSFTRPLSATYSAAYMIGRGYWDGVSGTMNIPVFGLYAGTTNSVSLTFTFSDGTAAQGASIATAAYTDSCNVLNNGHVVVQARKSTADLSFDYLLLKKICDTTNPTLIDTDGNVRWIGVGSVQTPSSIFFGNGFYVSNGTGVVRMEFDGTQSIVADYSGIGITSTGHHNFDPGRSGIVMDVNTAAQTESTNVEIDGQGNVLNVWNLGAIISAAMTAGGDDPSQFVYPVGTDWFHNNATTYNPADNTLIISSRENFVIAIDYDSQQIKWILGDPTKHWHQFKSLRQFALKLPPGTRAPIGQHALSIDSSGNLLLIDDGQNSYFQQPPGRERTYTAPRSYHIDTAAMTATEVFQYSQHHTVFSAICSSVYEDATPDNYLIDYAVAQSYTTTELVGLGLNKKKIFDYQYPAVNYCSSGWNASIIHLENLQF